MTYFTRHTFLVPGIVLGAVVGFIGCNPNWIREVKRSPSGGEVALIQQNGDAQNQAQALMTSRCPQGFDILEEGEAVVGQVAHADTTQRRTFFGPTQSTTATTEDKREWRIKYQCKAGGGAAPANTTTGAPAAPAAGVNTIIIRNY